MQEEDFQITEESEGIVRASFDEPPTTVPMLKQELNIFYLPKEDVLGGDSFVIETGNRLTIGLLSDFPWDGNKARKLVQQSKPHLERIVHALHTENNDLTGRFLYEFDRFLLEDLQTQTALTLVRISPNTMLYLNAGENLLMRYAYIEETISRCEHPHAKFGAIGKMGIQQLILDREGITTTTRRYNSFLERVNFEQIPINPHDKIVIASDGVYTDNTGENDYHIDHLERMFFLHGKKPGSEIMSRITSGFKRSLNEDQIRPPDDYTLIITQTP